MPDEASNQLRRDETVFPHATRRSSHTPQAASLLRGVNADGDTRAVSVFLVTGVLAMAKTTDIGSLIVQTPDVRGGRPRISGTGVTVRRIVGWYKLGLTAEEIVAELPHLTLAQVHAALAYCHANQEEIEQDIADEAVAADQLEHEHTKRNA